MIEPTHIAAYGDSTQWGALKDGNRATHPAPALVQALFHAAGHTDIVVENHGIGAIDTAERLKGNPATGICPWSTEMEGKTPQCGTDAKWVINNTTINDVFVSRGKTSLDQFTKDYIEFAKDAKTNQRNFIIETPNPVILVDQPGLALPTAKEQISLFLDYVERQRYVARLLDIPIIDQFQLMQWFFPGETWHQLLADGLHPNQYGYSAKALISFWTLYPLLFPGTNVAPFAPPWGPPRDVFLKAYYEFNDTTIANSVAANTLIGAMPKTFPGTPETP